MSSFNQRFTSPREAAAETPIVNTPAEAPPKRIEINAPIERVPVTQNDKPERLQTGKEIMTLEVRGGLFTNWTSVAVEQLVTKPFPTFQFECTEEADLPMRWDALAPLISVACWRPSLQLASQR